MSATAPIKLYEMGILQGRVHHVLTLTLNNVLGPHNVTIIGWKVLSLLSDNPHLTASELASILEVKPPLITRTISSLDENNFLKQTLHNQDKRAKILTVTKKGQSFLVKIEPEVKAALYPLLKGITAAELQTYKKVLTAVITNF